MRFQQTSVHDFNSSTFPVGILYLILKQTREQATGRIRLTAGRPGDCQAHSQ